MRFFESLNTIQAGPGCTQSGAAVECPNPLRIIFQGRDGNDSIRNLTGIRSTLEGFRGNDPLVGGSAGDILRGNAGTDSVNGGAGRDFCDAETEANCEQ